MRNISPQLQEHISGEVTTLANCWKLKLRNGKVLGFTNHVSDLEYEGVKYFASSGFDTSSIANSSDLAVDNLEIEGILDHNLITKQDILAGIYDFAEIEMFMVNYNDLTQGQIYLKRGWFGEITLKNGKFIAEIRGLTQKFTQVIGDLYSPTCRANFCDKKCKLKENDYTSYGSITEVINAKSFKDKNRQETSGYYTHGKIVFLDGKNVGIEMEIKEHINNSISTVLPMPFEIEVGDKYKIITGCDKTFETCKTKFDNIINFRGEPHIPGPDLLYKS
jgi:uncharacterized phage protein (TIGR02218 family)